MLLTKNIPIPAEPLHKVEYFLNIARALGIETKNKDYEFVLAKEDMDYIDRLFQEYGLKREGFLVVINPGGNWDLKRWPQENFALLAQRLVEDYNARVIITGAKSDLGLARNIASLMKSAPVVLCGKTTLGQLAALMARVDLVIANDSGPMHIALSQKRRVIALFGPTSAEITGPYGEGDYAVLQQDVGCPRPCYQLSCPDNRCMKAITVEEVLKAIK